LDIYLSHTLIVFLLFISSSLFLLFLSHKNKKNKKVVPKVVKYLAEKKLSNISLTNKENHWYKCISILVMPNSVLMALVKHIKKGYKKEI
jgi:hypothetical protein